LINPHIYSVGISKKLKQLKEKLVQQIVEKWEKKFRVMSY
jgi:hypothetical protein